MTAESVAGEQEPVRRRQVRGGARCAGGSGPLGDDATEPLAVSVGPLRLATPVLVASGTFGYASELAGLVDLRRLGGIVTKTVTVKPRPGNPPPRIVETPGGMLNAIGLQNVGVERFVTEKLPYLAGLDPVVLVSIMGYTTGEFLLAGASAVQVGTATFINPRAALDVLEGLESYLQDTGVERIADLVGAAQPQPAKEHAHA